MDMIIRRVRVEDDKPLVDIGIKDGRIAAIEAPGMPFRKASMPRERSSWS